MATEHKISFPDIERIATEQTYTMMAESDEESKLWFVKRGFTDDFVPELQKWGIHGCNEVIQHIIQEVMAEIVDEAEERGEMSGAVGVLPPDTMQRVWAACTVGMFQLGWVAHHELGASTGD